MRSSQCDWTMASCGYIGQGRARVSGPLGSQREQWKCLPPGRCAEATVGHSRCFLLCFFQGHLREGKCHLSLGNAMAACRSFQRALELDHKNSQAQQEVGSVRCDLSRVEMRGQWLQCRVLWGSQPDHPEPNLPPIRCSRSHCFAIVKAMTVGPAWWLRPVLALLGGEGSQAGAACSEVRLPTEGWGAAWGVGAGSRPWHCGPGEPMQGAGSQGRFRAHRCGGTEQHPGSSVPSSSLPPRPAGCIFSGESQTWREQPSRPSEF